ncbi:MAG TPA: YetF domain-containing protein [Armatimonadota bacterium]|jgi:uncharacterized membrane protein YcaP (DUF421 family)
MHASDAVVLAVAIRSAVVLLFLCLGLRLIGRRQLGQVNVYDLAMILALGNAVQNAMTKGSGSLRVGAVSAAVVIVLGRLFSLLFLRRPDLEERYLGSPILIISKGELVQENLRREHISTDQVMMALRQHGLVRPSQVKLAVLEIDGSLSVVPMPEEKKQ